jgi:hypothetical protein
MKKEVIEIFPMFEPVDKGLTAAQMIELYSKNPALLRLVSACLSETFLQRRDVRTYFVFYTSIAIISERNTILPYHCLFNR